MATTTTEVRSWTATTPSYPETLRFSKTTIPKVPRANHILVEVRAAALNPVDIQIMNLPINHIPGIRGPKIVGRDFSGVVIAVGSNVDHFQKGDEVFGIDLNFMASGFLTEVAHVDVTKTVVVKKPAHMTWVQAASLPLAWLTARKLTEKCAPYMTATSPAANKLVVLGGSSTSGIYVITQARRRGWTVLTSCSGRNTDFVKSLGADRTVDYTSAADAVVSAVTEFQPHAIVDCVGGTQCVGLAPRYVSIVGDKTSRAVLGGSAGYLVNPRMLLRWFFGYVGLGKSYECISLETRADWLEECVPVLKEGGQIVVDSVFGFEQVDEGFRRLDTGRARGKVVVEMKG